MTGWGDGSTCPPRPLTFKVVGKTVTCNRCNRLWTAAQFTVALFAVHKDTCR